MGKKVSCFSSHPLPQNMDYLDAQKLFTDKLDYKQKFDCVFFLDFTWYERIKEFTNWHEDFFDAQQKIIIDHHQDDNFGNAKLILKDKKSSSNCQIIRQIIKANRPQYITQSVATALYTWLLTDTGNFTFGNNKATAKNLSTGAQLLKAWADKEKIIKNLRYRQSLENLHFLEKLISRLTQKNKVMYSYYDQNDLEKYNIDKDQASILYNTVISKIYGPQVLIIFKIDTSELKGSVKQMNNTESIQINCAILAKTLFGGGGHVSAAGFEIPIAKDSNKQIKDIIDKIDHYISTTPPTI